MATAFGGATRRRLWLLALAGTSLAVLLSVRYLDRPLAILAQDWFGGFPGEMVFLRAPSFVGVLIVAVLAIFLLRRLVARPFGKADQVFLLAGASLFIGEMGKRVLKYAFGRTWPKYAHPSFLRDGVYGFNPFHSGYVFDSFPSGHMTALCALVSVLWIYYPRFRSLYAACIGILALILVAGDYHFLADVIAGGFLGASVGVMVASLWDLLGPRGEAKAGPS